MRKLGQFAVAFAVALVGFVASAVSTASYVQDGLIAHWDGIENVGVGQHDAKATAWVDLVAGRKFALTGVTINDDRLTFAGTSTSYGQLPEADTAATFDIVGAGGTVEIVLKSDTTDNTIAFQSPTTVMSRWNTRSIVYCGSGSKPELDWCWDDVATNTVSMHYESALVKDAAVNGKSIDIATTVNYWGASGKATVIGTRQAKSGYHFKGSIYAIRLYSRQLTPMEIALNSSIDEMRFMGKAGSGDMLIVSGTPVACGDVIPAYGVTNGLAVGTTFPCRAPAIVTNDAQTIASLCTGYKVYVGGVVKMEGPENAFSYTHLETDSSTELVWNWQSKYAVRAVAVGNGSVAVSGDGWYVPGETVTMTATAEAGGTFAGWTGDGVDPRRALENPYVLTVGEEPVSMAAKFTGALYVNKNGSDENDGSSPDSAYLTIGAALAAAPAEAETTVCVGPGTYTATNFKQAADGYYYALYLDKPVRLISTDGRDETIIDAGTDKKRALVRIAHEDAAIIGFSLVNGANSNGSKNTPSGLELSAGTASDISISLRDFWSHQGSCLKMWGTAKATGIVLSPKDWTAGERSDLVYLNDSAALDGLEIRGFTFGGTQAGRFLTIAGNACARNVLIVGNTMGTVSQPSIQPFVCLEGDGAVLEDSTIAGNQLLSGDGAVRIGKDKATVRNTIVYGNVGSMGGNPDIDQGNRLGRLFNCCTPRATAENGNVSVNPQFVDLTNGDCHLKAVSQAAEMGVVALRPTGPVQFDCAADATTYTSASGESLTTTFTGYVVGASGNMTAVWDFGDGTTSTDWPTATHTYETPGAYTVTLKVSDGTSTVTYAFGEPMTVVPATCYVKQGADGVYPYDSWEKATGDIYAAMDVGSLEVVVTNGDYEIRPPSFDIGRKLTLRSVEGSEKTSFYYPVANTDRRLLQIMHKDAVVSGFTFTNAYGSSMYYNPGGVFSAGEVRNCRFGNLRRIDRGHCFVLSGTAKVIDCDIDGTGLSVANGNGNNSGLCLTDSALMDRCRVHGFKLGSSSSNKNAPVLLNSKTAVVRNSYVYGNINGTTMKEQYTAAGVEVRGGRLENCTVTGNSSGGSAGGVWLSAANSTMTNCVVWGNESLTGTGNDVYNPSYAGAIGYCCASDLDKCAGGLTADCSIANPNLSTDLGKEYQLTSLSAVCRDKAWLFDWMADSLDIDGNPRIDVHEKHGLPDIGCAEFVYSDVREPLNAKLDVQNGSGRSPVVASFTATVVGGGDEHTCTWDFGDGSPLDAESGDAATHEYKAPGSYIVTLRVASDEETSVVAVTNGVVVIPETCYVSTTGASVFPYDSWEKAATNVIDATELGPRTVLVSNGVYSVGGEGIVLREDTDLRSLNGRDVTVIRGLATANKDPMPSQRLVWIRNGGASVRGFAFSNGASNTWIDEDPYPCFIRAEGGLVSDCIFSNIVQNYRSPVFYACGSSRVERCVFKLNNKISNDGGVYVNCVLVRDDVVMDGCEVIGFRQTTQSGEGNSPHGILHVEGRATVRNTLVHGNDRTMDSKGADNYRAAVILKGTCTFENCTVVSNVSDRAAGGLVIIKGAKPTVRNCIVWGNSVKGGETADLLDVDSPDAPRLTYSCAPELTTGEGNTTADPQFRTKRGVPYQFGSKSPCYDTAQRLDWMDEDAVDRLGNPRIFSTGPDMGCFESQSGGLMMFVR